MLLNRSFFKKESEFRNKCANFRGLGEKREKSVFAFETG